MRGPLLILIVWLATNSSSRVRAEEPWVATRTMGLFEVRSEFALEDVESQRIMTQIEGLQTDVLTHLNLTAGEQSVEVNLFRSQSTYRAFLSSRVPEGMNRPALFVQGTDYGRVYVYRRRGFDTDLRHECTHAVLHNALPYVPMWIDEGLAEYFEPPREQRSAGNPHLASLRRSIFFGWKPNLARLEQAENLSDMGAAEYREAWAWAHFLLNGPADARQVLSDYLYDISEGETAGSFQTRLLERVPDAERQLVNHIRLWR
ncbi:MAG: hypothetical protein DWH91_08070 [Planctomycetota bacterium]|nr:MAG: hypothetical protein DWH91_08070 [Planctomycetota bacterium]